jgi:hypothetical protein
MDDREKAVLHQIRPLAGLDPDGKLVPMQPYLTEAQQWAKISEVEDKVFRDLTLVYALRFT